MDRFFRFAFAALTAFAIPPAVAQDKPVLQISAPDSFTADWGPGPVLKAGFEETCGCTVAFSAAADGVSMLRRVQLEGATTETDLLIGLDTNIAGEARATGLFAPHGLDLPELALAETWSDPEFVPYDYGYYAFVYNKEQVTDAPRSFEELIALPESFKIVIQDPRSSTVGMGGVIWVQEAYGDRAGAIWEGLKPHVLTVTRGWSEAWGMFLDGETDMVLSYTTSPVYNAINEDDHRYAAAQFTEGHVAQVEVSGILKSTDQPELARQFLLHMLTPEAQAAIAMTNYMYPVISEAEALLPEPFLAQERPATVLPVDSEEVAAAGRDWIDTALGALQ